MRQTHPTDPPSAATWMLEHMTAGPSNEALAGDLLEDFRCGRSPGWYWRQVLGAIAISYSREILNHANVMLFAALWSMLAPAWLIMIGNTEERFKFSSRIWQMDWPWSTVCDVGLLLAANVLFIWVGTVLYLIPHLLAARNLRVRPLLKGIAAGLPALIALWAALVVLPKIFLESQVVDQHSVSPVSLFSNRHMAPIQIQNVSPQQQWDVRYGEKANDPYSNPRYAIIDMRTAAIMVRLPFFLTVLCSLWGVASRFSRRNYGMAA
jgi:hypothetical protein